MTPNGIVAVGAGLGGLAVAVGAFVTIGLGFGGKPWYHARLCVPASLILAFAALTWAAWTIVPGR